MDAFSKRRRIEADGGEIRVSEPSRRSEGAEEEEESAAAPAELESCCSVSEAGENGGAGEPSSLISFDRSIASSCCSSSVSEVETKCVDLEGESVIAVDDEDEASSERDRRGSMRREAGGEMKMGKTVGPAEGKRSYLQGGSAAGMPSELELEEFFAAAEKQIQQRFIQKYNYDVVNDVPLSGGRFEWV